MKIKSLMALAFTALTFTACSDVEDFNPNHSTKDGIVLFTAENPGVEPANATRVSIGTDSNGKIVPLWDEGDLLWLIEVGPTATLKCRLDCNLEQGDRRKAPFTINYLHATKVSKIDFFISSHNDYRHDTDKMMVTCENPINKNNLLNFKTNDILMSSLMRLPEFEGYDIFIKLKRLSAVVAMNISDGTAEKVLNGKTIKDIKIKAIKESPLGYTENACEIDYKTVELKNISKKADGEMQINFSEPCAVMDGQHPFYFSVLPFDITGAPEETAFELTITTNDGITINKVLKFGSHGTIKFEEGKYTTLNITIKDTDQIFTQADIPDYNWGGGVITMKKAGCLTSKIVAMAMSDKGITIKGNINATDIQAIKNVMNGTEPCAVTPANGRYDLNLREANIVAGGSPYTAYFQYQPGQEEQVKTIATADNILPMCFIDNRDTKVGNITLPSSLTTLDAYAIWLNQSEENGADNPKYNRMVNVSGKITTINGAWVRLYNWPTIYFANTPPAEFSGNWGESFNGLVPGCCNIMAYNSWRPVMMQHNTGETGTFFNRVFHSVRLLNHETNKDYFVENIYNGIDYKQVVTAGSGVINLRQSGTLTAWMIKKALKDGSVAINGNIGASDIAAIKTALKADFEGVPETINLDFSGANIVEDNTKFYANDLDDKMNPYKYIMCQNGILPSFFIDKDNTRMGRIILPAASPLKVDQRAFNSEMPNIKKTVVFKDNVFEINYCTFIGNNWDIYIMSPKSSLKLGDQAFGRLGIDTRLYIHDSWKAEIGTETTNKWWRGGTFAEIIYIGPGHDTNGTGAGDITEGQEVEY